MAEPDVLDGDDDDVRYLVVGPGRKRRATGPVIETYADGAIDRHCDNCGATPNSFCRHDNGVARIIPCPTR